MRFALSPETYLVPSRELRGSMAQTYSERTRRVHAVLVQDGEPESITVCGEPARAINTELDWESVGDGIRCETCGDRTGLTGLA